MPLNQNPSISSSPASDYPSKLASHLQIQVEIIEPAGGYAMRADHMTPHGFFARTDVPCLERQMVRLLIPTREDPPPLHLLAVATSVVTPELALRIQHVPGMTLQLYALAAYTRTRWHRWLVWLEDHQSILHDPVLRRFQLPADTIQRRYPRHAVCWQLRLIAEGTTEESHTLNLSVGGALIPSHHDIPLGSDIDVVLYHPEDGQQHSTPAKIIRRQLGQPAWHYGVAFKPSTSLQPFIESGIQKHHHATVMIHQDDPLLF